jgi:hypothetical protein
MTDPFFWIATVGLGLSGLVSAIKLIDWFLHSDPGVIAQASRLVVIGLFVLSIPLLVGLAVNHQWAAVIALSAVLLLAFAFYGPRVLRRLFPRRLYADWSGSANGYATGPAADYDSEMVQRSIAVLEEYLRRTAGLADGAEPNSRAQISHGGGRRDGRNAELDTRSMSEAEALEVLGIGPGAEESEINESHRRLMQLIHPDRGGSAYFAVKVNQAKDILLGRSNTKERRRSSTGARKRRRTANPQDISQSKPTAGG